MLQYLTFLEQIERRNFTNYKRIRNRLVILISKINVKKL